MTLIAKNHFALSRTNYLRGLVIGYYNNSWPENLSICPITPTRDNLADLQGRLSEKWHWKDQARYNDGSLDEKLAHPETALYTLKDNRDIVGYSLVSAPSPDVKKRFWKAANYPVIEIENLGLFPSNEGGGRGKAYFEMLFSRYFPQYETIYWTQHEIHSPTLKRFYQEKMRMTLLTTDHVPDFRPRDLKVG